MSNRDFPLEVLLDIFNYVYQLNRTNDPPPIPVPKFVTDDNETYYDYPTDPGPEVWEIADIRSPSLFPYSLERVSAHWRHAITGLPHCWTRIVIFYDDIDFSIASVRSNIEFSHNKTPLEITVARRYPTSFIGMPKEEKALLRQIIDLVAPHVHRCKSLVLSVAYPSSLPSLSADLCHATPLLTTLSLEAFLPSDLDLAPQTTEREFPFPALQTLTLSGWTFLDLFRHARWWALGWISYYHRYATLRVVNYSSPAPSVLDPRSILIDTIPLLDKLITVEFKNTSFDCIFDRSDIHVRGMSSLHQLHLTDIDDPKATKALVDNLRPTSLHITNCGRLTPLPLGSMFSVFWRDQSDVPVIVRALSLWQGNFLLFNSCSAFNDELLEALGRSKMSSLHLVDCRGFSIAALKRMMQRRKAYLVEHPIDEDPDDMLMQVRTTELQLSGRGVPDMTEDEMRWFKDNTDYLNWHGSQRLDG